MDKINRSKKARVPPKSLNNQEVAGGENYLREPWVRAEVARRAMALPRLRRIRALLKAKQDSENDVV